MELRKCEGARLVWPWPGPSPERMREFPEYVALAVGAEEEGRPWLVFGDILSGKWFQVRMLTVKEAAGVLGVSPGRVRQLAIEGRCGYVWKVGSVLYLREDAIRGLAIKADRDRRRKAKAAELAAKSEGASSG